MFSLKIAIFVPVLESEEVPSHTLRQGEKSRGRVFRIGCNYVKHSNQCKPNKILNDRIRDILAK
jgi:hypothetical protein